MAKVDNYTFLTTAPISKVIPKMAVPTIISMLVTSIYNIVDSYYVGQINTQATAAVGVVFPAMAVTQAVGFFFGQGAGTYISRELGAKRRDNAVAMTSTAFFNSFFIGIILAVLGLIFLKPLSIAFGSTPTILPYTIPYLGIILLGTPFVTATMTLNNMMRFQGNAASSMYGLLTGAILNVIIVPIFTFTLGLGIAGTAIGTVLSQIASFCVLLWMNHHGENIRLNFKNYTLKGKYYIELIKGGTPSLSRQGLASISTMMLNVAAAGYGDAAVAGMSLVGRVLFVVFSVIIGIGQGFQPFCGFNYGAKLYDRVRKGWWFTFKLMISFILIAGTITFIFADEIIDLLRHDPEVVEVGAYAMRWQIVTMPFVAFVQITNMTLQTSGWAVSANIVAATRNGLCFIPMILILPLFWGLFGVEISQSVADVLSAAIALPCIVNYFKKLKQ